MTRSRQSTDASYRVDFLPGQRFDIRLEVHAPVNGSEATGKTTPDSNFTFAVAKKGGNAQNAATFFAVSEPKLESWNFTWFEGQANLVQYSKPITHMTRPLREGCWDTLSCQRGRQSIPERSSCRARRVYCYSEVLQWLEYCGKLAGPRHTFKEKS